MPSKISARKYHKPPGVNEPLKANERRRSATFSACSVDGNSNLKYAEDFPGETGIPGVPKPWSKTRKPHPKTTPLARFWNVVSPTSALVSKPVANMIYQARCEISSHLTGMPVRLAISSSAECLVLSSAGNWKNRSPELTYWLPDGDNADLNDSHSAVIGLMDIAYQAVVDEQKKLIFVADESRIKSFSWASPSVDGHTWHNLRSALPVHTLHSGSFDGPLHVIGDHIFSAGKGSAAMWQINLLQTHGQDGTARIGKKIKVGDTWRDDEENIEPSYGSPPSQKIAFKDKFLKPTCWHPHPSIPGSMLCSSDGRSADQYSCIVLELESGKTIGRFLGHGADVSGYSTSESDPNVFLTACNDGYARLYDVRHPLPALTLNAGKLGEFCTGALLCHPDGIPSAFIFLLL
jgi:hypothetical protein